MGQLPSLEGEAFVVSICWIIAGGLSLIASCVQFVMVIHDVWPRWRGRNVLMKTYPQVLLGQLALATLLSALFYLMSPFQPESKYSMFCYVQFALATFPDLASDLLVCFLCISLLLLLWKSKFFHQAASLRSFLRKLMAATVIVCWGVPVALVVVAMAIGIQGFGPDEHWCWVEVRYYRGFTIAYYSFGNLVILFNILLFLIMLTKRKQIGSFQFQLLWYMPAFVIVYIPATVNRMLYISGALGSPALHIVAAMTLPLQGAVFLVVYLIIHFRWQSANRSGGGETLRLVSDQYQPRSMNAFGNSMFFYIEDDSDSETGGLSSRKGAEVNSNLADAALGPRTSVTYASIDQQQYK